MVASRKDTFFSITNKTKGKLPRLPFVHMKNAVLGKSYSLSLVIAGEALSQRLNRIYRHKNKPTNVLSFPLGKENGEIFLNMKRARREARRFKRKPENFAGFLFIHALMHLKGLAHGSRMESEEQKIRLKFKL